VASHIIPAAAVESRRIETTAGIAAGSIPNCLVHHNVVWEVVIVVKL